MLSVEPSFALEKAENPFLELGASGFRFPDPSDDPVEGSWPFKAWTSRGSAGAQAAMMTIWVSMLEKKMSVVGILDMRG